MKQLLFTLALLFLTATLAQATMASIAGEAINMRSGPGTRYPVQWELSRYYPLRVLKRQGEWLHVRDFEGDSGWVCARLTDQTPTVIVTKREVNLRSKPGRAHSIVGTAVYGDVLTILKRGRGWVRVKDAHKQVGWIKRSLVWGW